MDHNDIRHKLSEYLDGSVAPDEKAAIDAHLQTCEECANALAELRKTIEAIKQIEEVEAPAWMTSKIMAKVRGEQEARKGFWHRFFYPLIIKLPIQAVAVLFLTITVYYIYTAPSAKRYVEEPIGQLSKEDARPAAPGVLERKEPAVSARREKTAEQAPGYKSLDMKYAYEKPAAPVPQEQPAAATPPPMKETSDPLIMTKDEAAPLANKAAPAAAAPSLMAEQEAPAIARAEADREKRPAAPRTAAPLNLAEPAPLASGASGDKEAEAQLAVTEQFAKRDLPEDMKKKGLTFGIRKYRSDLTDLQWLPKTEAYLSRPCSDRYVVDVDLLGQLSKYLYCYDRSKAVLLGVYDLRNGVWSERK